MASSVSDDVAAATTADEELILGFMKGVRLDVLLDSVLLLD